LIVLDALTYAANPAFISAAVEAGNTQLVEGHIEDSDLVGRLFEKEQIDGVFHLAAESHVDRSIANPLAFVQTNVVGTAVLLNVARQAWKNQPKGKRFLHVSTDEVFGSLGPEGAFSETSPYDPRSPYSASKAASDHLARAYGHTYGMDVVVTNCSNNYGPHQYPEKLIPLALQRIFNGQPIPVYGKGANVRDWLHVADHVAALDLVFHEGKAGETYTIGTENDWANLALVKLLADLADNALGQPIGTSQKLITFVEDRAGHDLRYAINPAKIQNELGWKPEIEFTNGLTETIHWYLARHTFAKTQSSISE
jgi:dTDP-glucose 4,6-dehydratase